MRSSLFAAVVIAVVMAGAPVASAAEEAAADAGGGEETAPIGDATVDSPDAVVEPRVPKNQVRRVKVTRDIVFPVVGVNYFRPSFGDCRDNCEREHHGNDIMTYGWKGVPVVAAHDGWISKVRDDEWCNVEITGDDGWLTRYVHLNSDTPGYDDEAYECLPPGVIVGARVAAGEIIGWIGDSGNAEFTPPHLHFEIRMPNGLPVDPYRSLKSAHRIHFERTGGDDPVAVAAGIAMYAYRGGARVVHVMATTDHESFLAGNRSALDLNGPLLLVEPERIPLTTIEAFESLGSARVIVIGDGLSRAVLEQLQARFAIVEQIPMPDAVEGSSIEPDTGVVTVIPEFSSSPFALIVVGDRTEMPDHTADDLIRAGWQIPVTVLEGTDPDRRIGRHTYQGPGRSGSRHVLYYQTDDGYTRIRAKETPENPPDYGTFVIRADRASKPALTFFRSLAELPVMPLWR